MSIQTQVSELKAIEQDIKLTSQELKKLRLRKKELEKHISAYIKAKELPGVKHHGTVVLLEEKPAKAPKTKVEEQRDALRVLEQYGIHDSPEKVLEEILKARQGESIVVDKLKMKTYKHN